MERLIAGEFLHFLDVKLRWVDPFPLFTDGITADVTANTDFAQVEEDEQQANLTRDLFVVLTDNRDTLSAGFPELRNRALLVKVARLFRL